jgi:hypothetical protein
MLDICNKETRTRHHRPLLVGEEAGAVVPQSALRFAPDQIRPRIR